MKLYICDVCDMREPPQSESGYDMPPEGWYTLTEPGFKQAHLCGAVCLAERGRSAMTTASMAEAAKAGRAPSL